MFHPDVDVKVYDRDIWWSDKWDPTDYGMDYDFTKSFFGQYKELLTKVPLQNLGNNNCVNSPYVNHALDIKNCYFVYASYLAEDTLYSMGASSLKNCMDTYKIQKCEQCYEDSFCDSLYQVNFSFGTDQSINSSFLKECINCQDCILCINLRNKKYCFKNIQYTKDGYEEIKKSLDFGSYKNLLTFKNEYKNFILKYPCKYAGILKSPDSTGDCIMNSKNIKNCYDIYGLVEDSKYLSHGFDAKDSYDMYGFGVGSSLMYEGVDSGLKASNNLFCILNHGSMNTKYTYMCYNSKNLFGCIGIRKGEYCILNKKYSKEDYEDLVPKIIKQMNDMPYVDSLGRVYKYGEFFPSEISPFAYNETIAQEYYPKKIEEMIEKGFIYRKPIVKDYVVTIKSEDLPDHIKDIGDSILNDIISCQNKGNELTQCTFAYRIMREELDFLRKYNIAIPRYCPNCRHYERLSQRNPMKLWHRQCMKEGCTNEFETSYSPERTEIVYCEKCYQQEIF
jgi:hypothetical protein